MKRLALLALLLTTTAHGATIGTMVPAEPLTVERIASSAPIERAAWQDYLARSASLLVKDKASLAAELPSGHPIPAPAAGGNGPKSMPLDKPATWYGGAEARHIADVIVSFQTPAGGWGKNQPRDGAIRQPGQHYVAGEHGKDGQRPWNYVGTIDNDATVTEIRFLSRVVSQLPAADAGSYRASLLKGVDYLLSAQMPNGGWPQVWPLQGGYHDAITYNDDAFVHVAQLLLEVAAGKEGFATVPASTRERAVNAVVNAITCILTTQVVKDGERLGWGQQHDALTLRPVGARNFEPASLSSAESARILQFLMGLQTPTEEVKAAIRGGVAWLRDSVIKDRSWEKTEQGSVLKVSPGAKPLWARFYALDTNQPIFGDRDRTIHDDVAALSEERRNGYSWYNTAPQKTLEIYERWEAAN
ncbi:pectate lyase [Niveispirillum lacus]|uniref:Pectate lyase n=1 Tax=Niveispirillum lacus TaxID=1981099 RepID=A0A255Z0Q6_9PROT|nr:pectate lyase [Niveispirillum lacus]OYQ34495.1 pectate lyase [Niveispirillum lacus]